VSDSDTLQQLLEVVQDIRDTNPTRGIEEMLERLVSELQEINRTLDSIDRELKNRD
jgi:type VI protein secretion system component VasF